MLTTLILSPSGLYLFYLYNISILPSSQSFPIYFLSLSLSFSSYYLFPFLFLSFSSNYLFPCPYPSNLIISFLPSSSSFPIYFLPLSLSFSSYYLFPSLIPILLLLLSLSFPCPLLLLLLSLSFPCPLLLL